MTLSIEAGTIDVADRIVYADACMRAFGWHIREMERAEREYSDLTYELEAALVSSPRIKSRAEAWYKTSPTYSTGGLSDLLMDLLDARQERQQDWERAVAALHQIGIFLRRLSPEDVELMYRRYEWGQSLRQIATAMYMSHETVRKRITAALESFPV